MRQQEARRQIRELEENHVSPEDVGYSSEALEEAEDLGGSG